MPTGLSMWFKIIAWSTDAVTIIIALFFFYNFIKIQGKSYGLYMVLVLNACDFIFPLTDILLMSFSQTSLSSTIFGSIKTGIYHFGLYWSTAIAIFFYLLLNPNNQINLKKYMILSFSCCLGLAMVSMIMIMTGAWDMYVQYDLKTGLISLNYPLSGLSNQIGYIMTEDIIGIFVPILITFYCYFKVFLVLKDANDSFINPAKVLRYSAIQMVCFLPGIIADIVYISQDMNYTTPPGLITSILHRCWGFLNLLAYGFTNSSEKEEKHALLAEGQQYGKVQENCEFHLNAGRYERNSFE